MTVTSGQHSDLSQLLVFYGGTFDPIHNGHINIALAAMQCMDAHSIYLLPCFVPPHKKMPSASVEHRLNMLKIACESHPSLKVDERELRRRQTSYTYHSATEIRSENSATISIIWLIGSDSLQNLASWYQWQQIFNFINFAVLNRPGYIGINDFRVEEELQHRWIGAGDLRRHAHGKIAMLDTPHYDISSQNIRDKIVGGASIEDDVPVGIGRYIEKHGLYRNLTRGE